MKSFLKVMAVGSAVAFAVAMTPSTSFAGERFDHGGRDGWVTFGRVVTGVGFAANVIDHVIPRVVVGPVGYCPPAVAYAPVSYGYCGPSVVMRPEVRYCAPVRFFDGRGYDHYGFDRR